MIKPSHKVVSWWLYSEYCKIKASPYYFATNYLKVNGEPFRTIFNEKEFNQLFNNLEKEIINDNRNIR